MVPLTTNDIWLLVGLLGQLLFSARFLVQWLRSEVLGRSVIPVSFWFLSLAGAAVLLGYAVHRADPVFILGQSAGLLIYARNLILIHRRKNSSPRLEESA
jgi:lipid-A-disaccharide synthase-like uncharacterized protein